MPSPFDFQQDIAPYASSYFKAVTSNPFLNAAQRSALSGSALDELEKLRINTQKSDQLDIANELGRVRMERERVMLEDARDELARQRSAAGTVPVVQKELEDILKDPTLDQKQKKAAVAGHGMRYAGAVARSPELAAAFRFATAAADPDEMTGPTPSQLFSASQRAMYEEARRAESDRRWEEERRRRDTDSSLRQFESVLSGAKIKQPDEMMGEKTAKFEYANARPQLEAMLKMLAPNEKPAADDLSLYQQVASKRDRLTGERVPGNQTPDDLTLQMFGL